MADMAFSWARVNHEAVVEELGRRPGPGVLSCNGNIHLNVRECAPGMVLPSLHCPAMGVAIASLLSGRLPLKGVAVSGDLTTMDEFEPCVSTPTFANVVEQCHVRLLYEQGFRRLLVSKLGSVVPGVQVRWLGGASAWR